MMKILTRYMYSGVASIFTITAMANINATSLFMLYQPDVPCEKVVE